MPASVLNTLMMTRPDIHSLIVAQPMACSVGRCHVLRRLHEEELYDLYCLPDIIRVIKSRGMKWAGHVARTGNKRDSYRILM